LSSAATHGNRDFTFRHARSLSDLEGLLGGLDPTPIVRRRLPVAVAIMGEGQAKEVRPAVFGIAAAAAFHHADEAESLRLSDRGRNLVMRDAVVQEVLLRYG
jgi:hypothetical protein